MTSNRLTPRSFLAKEIRLTRETKGMTRDQLAQEVFVSESLVRAWESGRRVPQNDHLKKLEAVLGTNGYLARLRMDLVHNEPSPEYVDKWLQIEDQASALLWYQPLLIPGLLQTPEYAQAVIVKSGRQIDDLEALVATRLNRQMILAPEGGLVLVVVIDEGVLRRSIGGPKVMHEQLLHVLDVAQQSNVMVEVVPMEVGEYPGLAGGFGIAAMEGQEFAYVDDVFSGDVLEYPQDVAVVKRIWETIRNETLSGRQSLKLIAKAAEQWANQTK